MESEVIEQIERIVERYSDTGAHIIVPETLIGYKVKIAFEPEQTLTDWLKAHSIIRTSCVDLCYNFYVL
jgi:acyl CoA:acetate/3-ketoacid CoA transferase